MYLANASRIMAFICLQMETASVSSGTRYYVMAVTPTRLYSFTGFGSLEVSSALVSFLFSWLKCLVFCGMNQDIYARNLVQIF